MITWLYLVFVGAGGLGLLLAGVGILVDACTTRRTRAWLERETERARRPRGLREDLAVDLARLQRDEQDRRR